MRHIAISDIHGCMTTFKHMVEHVLELKPADRLYLLGDFIDRGPNSKGVLDYVIKLEGAGYKVYCIKGNHEDMMVSAYEEPDKQEIWLYNGGRETLRSFNVSQPQEIPLKYIDMVDDFDYHMEVEDYILVHAGLNFKGQTKDEEGEGFLWRLHNPLGDTKSMLWLRHWYEDIDWNWLGDRRIIHGHTPIEQEEIQTMLDTLPDQQVLDIDNGCFAKFRPGMGKLCAFDMSHNLLYFQDNLDE
ncbi:MAG: metallophosphoesterase family protein [Bacteroidota bacterium]